MRAPYLRAAYVGGRILALELDEAGRVRRADERSHMHCGGGARASAAEKHALLREFATCDACGSCFRERWGVDARLAAVLAAAAPPPPRLLGLRLEWIALGAATLALLPSRLLERGV